MKYFYLEPEVAGGPWKGSVLDRSVHPPLVSHLNFLFDGWLGDSLVEGFPCWIATVPVMEAIKAAGLTGVSFDTLDITRSDLFNDMYPDLVLPSFVWMKVAGTPGRDDFGVRGRLKPLESKGPFPMHMFVLVVSERALEVLKPLGISHAEITPWKPEEVNNGRGSGT